MNLAEGILDLLDIEELDKNLFRGRNEDGHGSPTLFGGQVAAQALMAAARTVAADRHPHSLHGYFLRPGRPDHPVVLQVAPDRDGRSFSARHVVALQRGEVIFSMSASFHIEEPGPEYSDVSPEAGEDPDAADEIVVMDRFKTSLRFKPLTGAPRAAEAGTPFPSRFWARTAEALPDRIFHACALVYLSDIGSGFAEPAVAGLPTGGPSLDHALWFHEAIRLDDWVLMEMWPLKAGWSRGLYAGSIRDRTGRLGALFNQEVLLRAGPSQVARS